VQGESSKIITSNNAGYSTGIRRKNSGVAHRP
jgi:hypothetical protein